MEPKRKPKTKKEIMRELLQAIEEKRKAATEQNNINPAPGHNQTA